jgi:hypothetical protein
MKQFLFIAIAGCQFFSCSKSSNTATPATPAPVAVKAIWINTVSFDSTVYGVNSRPVIKVQFTQPIQQSSVAAAVSISDAASVAAPVTTALQNNDSILVIQPSAPLKYLAKYVFNINVGLKSASGGDLAPVLSRNFMTAIDSADKFPLISDDSLLTLVQKKSFAYFWDFGHTTSGMARERNTDPNTVTTGGTGFGIMAIPVAINRGFISRTDGLNRVNTIVNFLATKAARYHGAFAHWLDGATGATIPFGNNNGADIVETSYLVEGLLCARQYFNGTGIDETTLRDSINSIWNKIEWSWFTRNGTQNALYWQYNSGYTNPADIWSIPVTGWNEALITYVLAASSPTYSISKTVYDNGWAGNGAIKNGGHFYGYTLPLGSVLGGPLFFEHYSFLGINPNSLTDQYADYQSQATNHALINYNYCIANPKHFYGYSNACWGLTASDIPGGYTASSPTNDVGVIALTAALSSFPYTPAASMQALKFFYYKLGDKLWGPYGFYDAFSLKDIWFANSVLAIDQGPVIGMIENYRTGLIWNLFMSCPEVKSGMLKLGFQSPHL